MTRSEKANALHKQGYNCAQSVFASCSDLIGLDEKAALAISGGFGGGLRCGEVCGAMSGALMAIGYACPFDDAGDEESKKKIAVLARELAAAFKEKCGAVTCTDLLGIRIMNGEDQAKANEMGVMKRCTGFITAGADIAAAIIEREKKA